MRMVKQPFLLSLKARNTISLLNLLTLMMFSTKQLTESTMATPQRTSMRTLQMLSKRNSTM